MVAIFDQSGGELEGLNFMARELEATIPANVAGLLDA